MKKIIALGVGFFLSSISIVNAQLTAGDLAVGTVTNVLTLRDQLNRYFGYAAGVLISIAGMWVVWNSFQFVMSAGDEEARSKARSGIIYGIIGIVVMLSVWGIVGVFASSTGLNTSKTSSGITPPTF